MKRTLIPLALAVSVTPAFADEDAFVSANLLSILYHELGHAIIDIEGLPVFGQEEDAADVASVLLIDAFFEEDAAVEIAYEAAFGFLAEAEERESSGEEVAWWDTHGPDLQRYYNLVCLFAGADIEAREDVALELGLPEERLDNCEDEFGLANDSWGPVFDELARGAPAQSLVFMSSARSGLTHDVVSEEVAALNESFKLSDSLTVKVESCGEANAFYDLDAREIIMCTEFEAWLRKAYALTSN